MKHLKLSAEEQAMHQEDMEHFSKRGITILSSRRTPSGKLVHEVAFRPGGATIFSPVPDQGRPKATDA
jgi:hypothetical protein